MVNKLPEGNPEKLPDDTMIDCTRHLSDKGARFLAGEMLPTLKGLLGNKDRAVSTNQWINESADCKVLIPGKHWRKGKVVVRLQLEFYPDEPDPQTQAMNTLDQLSS